MGSKYICKFCKRNFPCGRSLGGHIRSHLIHTNNNSTIIFPSNHQPKSSKTGYELRENPKKTNKGVKLLSSSSSSWSNESESDPISIHKEKKNGKGSSSFVVGNNHSHSSVSEVVEGDQDEVAIAMCLIMLSRDAGKWGNVTSCESNDDILLLQPKETKKFTIKTEKKQGKCSVFDANCVDGTYTKGNNMGVSCCGSLENGSKMKNNDQCNKVFGSKSEEVENVSTWNLQCGLKLKENEALPNGLMLDNLCNKPPLSKRKIDDDKSNKKRYEIATNGGLKNWSKMMEFEVCEDEFVLNDKMTNTNKRSKFECATCKKVFHSYQALGGHRASHKRVLLDKNSHVFSQKTGYPPPTAVTDSLISNLDEFANGEYDLSTPPPPYNNQEQQQKSINDIRIGSSSSLSSKKFVQKHECPFCFRVFSSGQALGGHKRSHMLGNNNNNNLVEINMVGRSSSKTRDLLDLNLPPTHIEEDTTTITTTTSSSKSHAELIKPYWWVEHQKHEPTSLSLISN